MPSDRRASSRDHLFLPMTLADGSAARTRNVSANGLFFTLPPGREIEEWLLVEFEVPSAGLKFSAAGQVVRVERGDTEDGVALKLHAPRLTRIN